MEVARIERATVHCALCREELKSLGETRALLQSLPEVETARSFVFQAPPIPDRADRPQSDRPLLMRVPAWTYGGAATLAVLGIVLFSLTGGVGIWTSDSEDGSSESLVLSSASPESAAEGVGATVKSQESAPEAVPGNGAPTFVENPAAPPAMIGAPESERVETVRAGTLGEESLQPFAEEEGPTVLSPEPTAETVDENEAGIEPQGGAIALAKVSPSTLEPQLEAGDSETMEDVEPLAAAQEAAASAVGNQETEGTVGRPAIKSLTTRNSVASVENRESMVADQARPPSVGAESPTANDEPLKMAVPSFTPTRAAESPELEESPRTTSSDSAVGSLSEPFSEPAALSAIATSVPEDSVVREPTTERSMQDRTTSSGQDSSGDGIQLAGGGSETVDESAATPNVVETEASDPSKEKAESTIASTELVSRKEGTTVEAPSEIDRIGSVGTGAPKESGQGKDFREEESPLLPAEVVASDSSDMGKGNEGIVSEDRRITPIEANQWVWWSLLAMTGLALLLTALFLGYRKLANGEDES